MAEDLYADAVPAGESEPAAAPDKEEASDSATAVIPTALLAGKEWKPGDEIVLEIVQVNEDGAVVKYASPKGEEKGEGEEEAPGGMSSMMEGGGGGGGGNPGGNPGY